MGALWPVRGDSILLLGAASLLRWHEANLNFARPISDRIFLYKTKNKITFLLFFRLSEIL